MTIDAAKAARWLKRELRLLDEHLATENEGGFPIQHRQALVGYAAGVASVTTGDALVALYYLSSWLGANGCVRALRGDRAGFADLDLACVYGYWSIRLRVRAYDGSTKPDKQPTTLMDNVATCWMHADAIGANDIRNWLGERIRRVDSGDASIDGKDMNELCALTAHFVTGKDVAALRNSGWARLGPYQSVATRNLVPDDYDELATYHTKSVDGAGFPAFAAYPYRLAPFELLVVEERTGIAIGANQHPLLTSPLAERRRSTIDTLPVELRPVIDRMRTIFEV